MKALCDLGIFGFCLSCRLSFELHTTLHKVLYEIYEGRDGYIRNNWYSKYKNSFLFWTFWITEQSVVALLVFDMKLADHFFIMQYLSSTYRLWNCCTLSILVGDMKVGTFAVENVDIKQQRLKWQMTNNFIFSLLFK